MSFIKRLFSKKPEDDYETILATLADDIQKRQLKLSEIRLRERRSTLLVTLYTLAAWVAYVSVWYLGALPTTYHASPVLVRGVNAAPVVVGPIIVLFIRRIVQIWYQGKGDAEEKTIKQLIKQRREKVEEIKAKTKFYSTRDLLSKYDDATPPTPARPPPNAPMATGVRPGGVASGVAPVTPQRPIPGAPNPNFTGTGMGGTPGVAGPGVGGIQSPMTPAGPRRRQWYDKLADAILGDDDPTIGSPSTRYALICEKCFSHNGLVKESMWEDAQYVCPKCNHFNPSANAKRALAQSARSNRNSLSPQANANSTPSGRPSVSRHSLGSDRSGRASTSASPPQLPDVDLPTVDADAEVPMDVDESVVLGRGRGSDGGADEEDD